MGVVWWISFHRELLAPMYIFIYIYIYVQNYKNNVRIEENMAKEHAKKAIIRKFARAQRIMPN